MLPEIPDTNPLGPGSSLVSKVHCETEHYIIGDIVYYLACDKTQVDSCKLAILLHNSQLSNYNSIYP
jgi:hypothetical protein